MTDEGSALKADLTLRSQFPHLTTRIFELSNYQYMITFDRKLLDANSIAAHFNEGIRPITSQISISNTVPDAYVREIDPLSDQEIARDLIALPLTNLDLTNLLAAKFPDFDLAAVNTVSGGVVELVCRTQPSPELQIVVQRFCDNFKTHDTLITINPSAPELTVQEHHSTWQIKAAKLRSTAPQFVRDDEIFWFDNIERIYNGSFTFEPIPGTADLGSSCFIDFSYGDDQLNLRQALLYYDTVLVTPPINETKDACGRQRLSIKDCLKLVEAGRLKFVLSQSEDRGDTRLVEAAYATDPLSVIGRRSAAAAMLADLVKTSQEYRLNDAALLPGIGELSGALSASLNWTPEEVSNLLMWPMSALRQSLYPLSTNGALGISAFGQDQILAKNYQTRTGRDLRLEMTGLGFQTHLAHALNATVIPYVGQPESWIWIYRTIGDRLNFYRSFNIRIAAAWASNERRKQEKRAALPALPLFEFDVTTPIDEFIQVTALTSVRRKGRALLTRLIDLPPDDRPAEIAKLSAHARGLRGREAGLFSLESLEDAGPMTDMVVGAAAPPFFAMRNLIARIIHLRSYSPSFDNIVDAIEREINPLLRKNEDLEFLSKVDRVAQLKVERIS